MISGRAAYAVLAAFLMAAVLLLAAPAWSQDKKDPNRAGDAARKGLEREKGKASERAGEATADEGSSRIRKDSERSRNATAGESSKRDRNNASSKDSKDRNKASSKASIEGKEVEVRSTDTDDDVDDGDVLIIRGNYDISQNPSVKITDGLTEFKFDDRTDMSTKNGDLNIAVDSTTGLSEDGELEVLRSHGFVGGHGRGGRGGRDACRQNIDVGSLQYLPIEQICIIERGGIDGRRPFPPFPPIDDFEDLDFFEELEELLEEDDEEVVIRTEPDGVVADTSAVGKLPFTGGPSFTGVAVVIAALALLGAGAGVVMLRLGRGRSGG